MLVIQSVILLKSAAELKKIFLSQQECDISRQKLPTKE